MFVTSTTSIRLLPAADNGIVDGSGPVQTIYGAPPRTVVASILRRGMSPVLVGLILGSIGSFAAARLMRGLLYGVSPTDTATFVATAGLLASVALIAAFLPARRAAKLDPLRALRQS